MSSTEEQISNKEGQGPKGGRPDKDIVQKMEAGFEAKHSPVKEQQGEFDGAEGDLLNDNHGEVDLVLHQGLGFLHVLRDGLSGGAMECIPELDPGAGTDDRETENNEPVVPIKLAAVVRVR